MPYINKWKASQINTDKITDELKERLGITDDMSFVEAMDMLVDSNVGLLDADLEAAFKQAFLEDNEARFQKEFSDWLTNKNLTTETMYVLISQTLLVKEC